MQNHSIEVAASASRTTSGNSGWIDNPGFVGLVSFMIDETAQAGAGPTLDVDIEVEDPVSGQTYVAASFTQIGAATSKERITLAELPEKRFRAAWTLGGGSPDYTFSIAANGRIG